MINAPQIQVPTQMPCCGCVNAKAFEILLIIGFILSTAGLTVNFILNMYIFKYSYSIFSLEIVLMALNVFCLIFAIVLRVWRSNGSVLTTSYSSSLCLSSVILVFSIISLLGSGALDGLFYYTIDYLTGDIFDKIDDPETLQKRDDIYKLIFNKNEDMSKDNNCDISDDKTKLKILKLAPWISINLNAFVQVLSIFFLCIIRQRIKFKSDVGSSQSVPTQTAQPLTNRMDSQRNSGTNLGLSNNNMKNSNIYEGETKIKNTYKKKKKKYNKNNEKEKDVPESDDVEIVGKKKKKKKKSKKKSKSKDKGKKNSKNKAK